jgi:hypothetical protein
MIFYFFISTILDFILDTFDALDLPAADFGFVIEYVFLLICPV